MRSLIKGYWSIGLCWGLCIVGINEKNCITSIIQWPMWPHRSKIEQSGDIMVASVYSLTKGMVYGVLWPLTINNVARDYYYKDNYYKHFVWFYNN